MAMFASCGAFVTDLADRYLGDFAPAGAAMIRDEMDAGEHETAAIMLIENAPVTAREIDTFETFLHVFDTPTQLQVARRLIATRRKQLAA